MNEHNQRFDLDRILRIPILDVVRRFAPVERRGLRWVSQCPWHPDHHPSLVMDQRTGRNHVHCFACGNGGSALDYVRCQLGLPDDARGFVQAAEWLSQEFGIPKLDGSTATSQLQAPAPAPTPTVEEPVLTFVPTDYVQRTISTACSFAVCLQKMFGYEVARRITEQYQLGLHSNRFHRDGTIFWSIDQQGRVRGGKVQCYDTDIHSPRFGHSREFTTSDDGKLKAYWLTNELRRRHIIAPDAVLNTDCLYGEHLLPAWPREKPIALVESPKNALLGAVVMPDYLWLATGSMGQFKPNVMQVLEGRFGEVYPDRDAIPLWQERLRTLPQLAGFTIRKTSQEKAPAEELKYDIADFIIGLIRPLITGQ